MADDCDVCEDFDLLQAAACNEKDFRFSVIKTLCYVVGALAAQQAGGDCTCVENNAEVAAANTAGLVAGTDGSNYKILSTDSTGRLNVNSILVQPAAAVANQSLASVTGVVSIILPANTDRIGGWLTNKSATDSIFVRFGASATILLPTELLPGSSLSLITEGVVYTGIVTAITAGSTNSLEVTELEA